MWWLNILIILKSWQLSDCSFPCSKFCITGKNIIVLMVFILHVSHLLWHSITTLIFCRSIFEKWLKIKILTNRAIDYQKKILTFLCVAIISNIHRLVKCSKSIKTKIGSYIPVALFGSIVVNGNDPTLAPASVKPG